MPSRLNRPYPGFAPFRLLLTLCFIQAGSCASRTDDVGANPFVVGDEDGDAAPISDDDAAPTSDSSRDASVPGTGARDAAVDAATAPPDGSSEDDTAGWVLAYFGPGQELRDDSLHLAVSRDGLHWTELRGGPVYQLSGLGSNHIRDPFLLRKQDGSFVYLATDWTLAVNDADYWNRPSPRIFVADSTDLIHFSNPRLVTLTNLSGPGGTAMHAWAPEAFYDAARERYAIVWSGNDESGRNHLYASYTADFTTLDDATPTVWFDPGYSVIDGTVVRANGHYSLFFKNDLFADIQVARTDDLSLSAGSFTVRDPSFVGSSSTTGRVLEGPFVIQVPDRDRFYVFADRYTQGGKFAGFTTTDLDADPATFTELLPAEFHFPAGVRHANAVRVTEAELTALIAHYGAVPEVQLRTTYAPGGTPHYVAHSWYHAMITFLGDTSFAQLPEDFRWKLVPGLADPDDPSLVSFEAVAQPGRYLRIDSANPSRYPDCSEGANRITEACSYVPEADRHHLGWVDPYADTAAFRSDATFRKVPALDGDPAHVSFEWLGDSTRHVRHEGFQLFAHVLGSSADDASSASFSIEPL